MAEFLTRRRLLAIGAGVAGALLLDQSGVVISAEDEVQPSVSAQSEIVGNLILAHGRNSNPEDPFLQALAQQFRRRFRIETHIPELSLSDPADMPASINTLTSLMDQLQQESVPLFVGGWSMGAFAAISAVHDADIGVSGLMAISCRFKDKRPLPKDLAAAYNRTITRPGLEPKIFGQFLELHSNPDTVVPFDNGERVRDMLGATLVEVPGNRGHFGKKEDAMVIAEELKKHQFFAAVD